MYTAGITGGVGAGKSMVLGYLEQLPGVRVIQADAVGHLVMEPGQEAYARIREHFGGQILDPEGRINRPALASIVFQNEQERTLLNQIVHPAVKNRIRREQAEARERGNCRLLVIEAALLIEDHYEELCEEFWYIYASEEVRAERLKTSRGYSEEKIRAILASQRTDAEFRAHCREVIENGGTKEETEGQLRALLVRKNLFREEELSCACAASPAAAAAIVSI